MDAKARLAQQYEFLSRDDVAQAFADYAEESRSAAGEAHSLAAISLPDPIEYLAARGIELPPDSHLLATHTVDDVEVARMGTECISFGKLGGCFCKKTCETDSKGRKHCSQWCL